MNTYGATQGTVPVAPVGRRRAYGGGMGGGGRGGGGGSICMYILAILLPPLAVFFETGCGGNFCINVLLTILGWLPGILHAFYVIMTHSSRRAVAY